MRLGPILWLLATLLQIGQLVFLVLSGCFGYFHLAMSELCHHLVDGHTCDKAEYKFKVRKEEKTFNYRGWR